MKKKNIIWLFVAWFAFVCSTTILSSCSKDKDESTGFPEEQIEEARAKRYMTPSMPSSQKCKEISDI